MDALPTLRTLFSFTFRSRRSSDWELNHRKTPSCNIKELQLFKQSSRGPCPLLWLHLGCTNMYYSQTATECKNLTSLVFVLKQKLGKILQNKTELINEGLTECISSIILSSSKIAASFCDAYKNDYIFANWLAHSRLPLMRRAN